MNFTHLYSMPFIALFLILMYLGINKIKRNVVYILLFLLLALSAVRSIKLMPYAAILGIVLLSERLAEDKIKKIKLRYVISILPVSYTHLTLPTILLV